MLYTDGAPITYLAISTTSMEMSTCQPRCDGTGCREHNDRPDNCNSCTKTAHRKGNDECTCNEGWEHLDTDINDDCSEYTANAIHAATNVLAPMPTPASTASTMRSGTTDESRATMIKSTVSSMQDWKTSLAKSGRGLHQRLLHLLGSGNMRTVLRSL
jgi:hypothetical protein